MSHQTHHTSPKGPHGEHTPSLRNTSHRCWGHDRCDKPAGKHGRNLLSLGCYLLCIVYAHEVAHEVLPATDTPGESGRWQLLHFLPQVASLLPTESPLGGDGRIVFYPNCTSPARPSSVLSPVQALLPASFLIPSMVHFLNSPFHQGQTDIFSSLFKQYVGSLQLG